VIAPNKIIDIYLICQHTDYWADDTLGNKYSTSRDIDQVIVSNKIIDIYLICQHTDYWADDTLGNKYSTRRDID
jgi:hypothetical protein